MSLSEERARQIAMDWHAGQWSALYAFASSGHVERHRLIAEVQSEINDTRTSELQRVRLRQLLAYIEAEPADEPPK